LNPEYFWWVTPIIGALLLSIPLSVFASRVSVGRRARSWGLFLTPEEIAPPRELRDLAAHLAEARRSTERLPAAERDGFVRAIVDPYVNALHTAFLRTPRRLRDAIRMSRRALMERALEQGPHALGTPERKVLLHDPDVVAELHRRVWQLADRERAELWGRPGEPQSGT
jgi:membrane glycosyltransferase